MLKWTNQDHRLLFSRLEEWEGRHINTWRFISTSNNHILELVNKWSTKNNHGFYNIMDERERLMFKLQLLDPCVFILFCCFWLLGFDHFLNWQFTISNVLSTPLCDTKRLNAAVHFEFCESPKIDGQVSNPYTNHVHFRNIFPKSEKPKISKNPDSVALRAAYLKISCKGAEGIHGIIHFPAISHQK